jgi:hypothetical protein
MGPAEAVFLTVPEGETVLKDVVEGFGAIRADDDVVADDVVGEVEVEADEEETEGAEEDVGEFPVARCRKASKVSS